MNHYSRLLDLTADIQKKSLFLFSPRQTGKSTLLKKTFPTAPTYNLLLADEFLKLSQRPQLIREELLAAKFDGALPVIIDEIQKLPVLLDEVHYLIEEKGYKFILTGSSPRKLKRDGVNLLGGRAWTRHLYPLTTQEIGEYDLDRMWNFGSLPPIYNSSYPEEDLAAYAGNYLQEEIQAEGAVRHIENFSRFLRTAAISNTELINFESVASDAQVPARTIREYFNILQDTLLGVMLEPYKKTKSRKAVSTSKFYFFDVGVTNFLAERGHIKPKSELFGKVFEHFIFTELRAFLGYTNDRRKLAFWRSRQGDEVDFIVGDDVAIEVKGTEFVSEKHLKGIKTLNEEVKFRHNIVVSLDEKPRHVDGVEVLPVKDFLTRLWCGEF